MPLRVTENDAWLKALAGYAKLALGRDLFLVSNFGSVLVFSKIYRSNGHPQPSSADVNYQYYSSQHRNLLSCIEHYIVEHGAVALQNEAGMFCCQFAELAHLYLSHF